MCRPRWHRIEESSSQRRGHDVRSPRLPRRAVEAAAERTVPFVSSAGMHGTRRGTVIVDAPRDATGGDLLLGQRTSGLVDLESQLALRTVW